MVETLTTAYGSSFYCPATSSTHEMSEFGRYAIILKSNDRAKKLKKNKNRNKILYTQFVCHFFLRFIARCVSIYFFRRFIYIPQHVHDTPCTYIYDELPFFSPTSWPTDDQMHNVFFAHLPLITMTICLFSTQILITNHESCCTSDWDGGVQMGLWACCLR